MERIRAIKSKDKWKMTLKIYEVIINKKVEDVVKAKEVVEVIDKFEGEEYTDLEIWEEIKKELARIYQLNRQLKRKKLNETGYFINEIKTEVLRWVLGQRRGRTS